MNEEDICKEIEEKFGYIAENTEEGFIDVFGKSNEGLFPKISIEKNVIIFLEEHGYKLYRISFQGMFNNLAVFIYKGDEK